MKFHLLLPTTLREKDDCGVVFLPQVEGQLGADPLLCTVDTLPFDLCLINAGLIDSNHSFRSRFGLY